MEVYILRSLALNIFSEELKLLYKDVISFKMYQAYIFSQIIKNCLGQFYDTRILKLNKQQTKI